MNQKSLLQKNDDDKWIEKEFNEYHQIKKNIEEYRLDFAINEVYEFFFGVNFAINT